MASEPQPDVPLPEEPEEELIPWENTGLGAEPSEVEDPALKKRRSELAQRWVSKPHPTAMLERFDRIITALARFLFAHVQFDQRNIDKLNDASCQGTVVYVMRSRSLLDYLYFNWAFQNHELPKARFSNGPRTIFFRTMFGWLASFLTPKSSTKPEELLQSLVTHGESVFIFLEQPKATGNENVEYSQKYLYRMIRAQRKSEAPVIVAPLLLVWEKRPDSKHPTLLDDIFGTAQSPGFFRKLVNFVQAFWQSFLKFGQPVVQVSTPVNLKDFLREYPSADSADASEMLRQNLLETLASEERVILGPTGEEAHKVWRDMLHRPELAKVIKDIATEEGVGEEEVTKRARANFEEIAADPNLLVIKLFSSLLSFVWYRIYDGFEVDEDGLTKLREAAKDSNIVLIPSHKSHIDYLVLSYLFYKYGLTPPLIAAGVNLSFWPLGPLFRRSGAFFLRRSFKGDDLYAAVFREYVIRMLEEGYPIEFFIEGTRSRTGKLIKPRYGMLDMVIRAYASGRLDALKVVPISVGYEKIIEEGAYRDELLGGEKEKESLGALLKAPKFLTSKYGRLYVEFNDPIDLEEYLEKFDIDRTLQDEEQLRNLNVRLAHRVIYDINQVTTVTPSALAATILLNNEGRGIDRARFLGEVGFLLHFLQRRGQMARMSRTLEDRMAESGRLIESLERQRSDSDEERSMSQLEAGEFDVEAAMGQSVAPLMDWALELFEKANQVTVREFDDEVFYSVPEEARHDLSYYRNNIVHHFVPEALLAAAIAKFRAERIDLDELMSATLFLSRLFKYEWIYEERAEFENVFMRTLVYFESSGWVTQEAGEDGKTMVKIAWGPPPELAFFRRLVLTFLEAYAIVGSILPQLEKPTEGGEIVERALTRARNDYLRGRVLFHESLSKPTYLNALRLFVDWKVLDKTTDDKGKDVYQLSEHSLEEGQAKQIHEQLKRFVY